MNTIQTMLAAWTFFCDPVAEVTGIINKIGNNKMTQINALLGEIKKQSSE